MRKRIQNCKKCKERKINVLKVDRKIMIDSFELYHTAGMGKTNYTRWMTDTVLPLGCAKKDYLPSLYNIRTKMKLKRSRLRYYLKIDFAISICLLMRRKKSIEIRNFLIQVNNGRK